MSRQTDKEQLLDEMSSFNRKLRTFFDARVGEQGLTLTRARVLFVLSRRGSLTQKQLAEELEIETPTLVRVLDGMEKQNLIERRAEEGDRRAKRIHMTPDGELTAASVNASAEDLRKLITADISSEDIATSLNVVRSLITNIQALSSSGEGR